MILSVRFQFLKKEGFRIELFYIFIKKITKRCIFLIKIKLYLIPLKKFKSLFQKLNFFYLEAQCTTERQNNKYTQFNCSYTNISYFRDILYKYYGQNKRNDINISFRNKLDMFINFFL
ncbi:hypothetical protein EDEG_03891 [Edhazardia aedis USNM 41457]|uniref:Uncharacterized protein n=1 Tax=Edhazardia aedis (strain USNM 41457) TaxID=1003232 RepID=J9DG09_EDHAE|nr:hypothetical protein EDEG_03891 [Edhazardia aedis USNM 41457]|eukprot:EJW01540.1 hypothetical protein EDEG_03891 [Edhazardia aedis USNM 41457]